MSIVKEISAVGQREAPVFCGTAFTEFGCRSSRQGQVNESNGDFFLNMFYKAYSLAHTAKCYQSLYVPALSQ